MYICMYIYFYIYVYLYYNPSISYALDPLLTIKTGTCSKPHRSLEPLKSHPRPLVFRGPTLNLGDEVGTYAVQVPTYQPDLSTGPLSFLFPFSFLSFFFQLHYNMIMKMTLSSIRLQSYN